MEWASLHWQVLVLLTKSAFVCDIGFIYIYNDCFQYKDIHMHLYLIEIKIKKNICFVFEQFIQRELQYCMWYWPCIHYSNSYWESLEQKINCGNWISIVLLVIEHVFRQLLSAENLIYYPYQKSSTLTSMVHCIVKGGGRWWNNAPGDQCKSLSVTTQKASARWSNVKIRGLNNTPI